jgi:(hydroxyamino)benzene mutase
MPQTRSLVVAGAVLFLLGLVEGAGVPLFANPRMALSAHLTAAQSGTALMIVGVVWPMAIWSPIAQRLSMWTIVVGFYGLWLALTLAAMTGASEALPIAGHGFGASRATEAAVSVIVIGSSGVMTIGWLIFLIALVRRQKP